MEPNKERKKELQHTIELLGLSCLLRWVRAKIVELLGRNSSGSGLEA
jgi:hypothetical protein